MTDTKVEQEVRAALKASREALNNGDRDGFASSLSTSAECTMIGSDPEEWYTGTQLLANWDEAMTAGGNPVRAMQDEVFVHVNGDVAWVEGRGRIHRPFRTRECPVRLTGVLLKEDGKWKGVRWQGVNRCSQRSDLRLRLASDQDLCPLGEDERGIKRTKPDILKGERAISWPVQRATRRLLRPLPSGSINSSSCSFRSHRKHLEVSASDGDSLLSEW